jgi:hypothetical protein
MKVLSVKLKKALLELTLGSKTPREPFMKLITVTGDQEVALRLLPIFTTFIDWRAGVLSTRRVFAANEYQKKFAEALFADVRSKFEEINPVFRDRLPIKLSEAELKDIEERNRDVARMEQLAPGSPNGVPAAVAAPPGAAVVQTTGEPGAGTGLFAAPAAAPIPDTGAIQAAEARVREEAAAALAATVAAATEERTAAVQATEKRIREEAAAAQATLESRALAAENALGLNREDVAKKAAELLELRASAEKHENDAQIAATAAKEQEARAQRAEGQLNAAKEALQTLSVGHMSTSSRVPSLAESEARTARLEATKRLAEAQSKAASVGVPAASVVDRTSDVRDIIEEAASPAAAASDSASAADRIAKMAEESADRSRAAAAAQRVQTEKTLNDQVIAARANLERIQEQDRQLEELLAHSEDPNIGLKNRLDAARTSAVLQGKLKPGDAAVRPPLSASPPPPPAQQHPELAAAEEVLQLYQTLSDTDKKKVKQEYDSLDTHLTRAQRFIEQEVNLLKEGTSSDAVIKRAKTQSKSDLKLVASSAKVLRGAINVVKLSSNTGGRRRKTSKRRQRKPRKSTFRRHRKH